MIDEYHRPVLVDEVLFYLQPKPDGIYVDGTLGGGGYTEKIAAGLSSEGRVVGFDMDDRAIEFAGMKLQPYGDRVLVVHSNFINLRAELVQRNIRHISGIVFDLGVSSQHLDDPDRGFSFQSEGSIDMRMDRRQALDGQNIVNRYSEESLQSIITRYGEERNAKRIARKIVDVRKQRPITTTREFAEIVESVVGKRFSAKSLARVFQAIRIEVNHELENLRTVLRDAVDLLEHSGRIVVVSYHSLEDKIVKECFKEGSRNSIPSRNKFLPDLPFQPLVKILTKKPVTAQADEVRRNHRARSAKLRAAEKL